MCQVESFHQCALKPRSSINVAPIKPTNVGSINEATLTPTQTNVYTQNDKSNSSSNVNAITKRNLNGAARASASIKEVQAIANVLAERLDNPQSLNFYYKVAWHLPESNIWYALESALRGRNPQKLFSYLCNKEMC